VGDITLLIQRIWASIADWNGCNCQTKTWRIYAKRFWPRNECRQI